MAVAGQALARVNAIQYHEVIPNGNVFDDDEEDSSPEDSGIEGDDNGLGREMVDLESSKSRVVTPASGNGWTLEKVREFMATIGHAHDKKFVAGSAKFDPLKLYIPETSCYINQYPLHPDKQSAVSALVADLLAKGAVERCERGRFNFPVSAVKKTGQFHADGSQKYRLVGDLRGVNNLTPSVRVDTESIFDICRRLAGPAGTTSRLFAAFDVRDFFFNFKVDEASREIFQFTCNGQYYRNTTLAMGYKLSNALTSAALMSRLSTDITSRAGVYCDDIVLAADTEEELVDLCTKFGLRMAELGFLLNAEKTVMAATAVPFAGFEIRPGKVGVSPEHVHAIRDYPEPTTKLALARFVHLTRWISNHCESFETLASPLQARALLAKTTVTLTDDERVAFEAIRARMTSDAFLVPFDESRMLYVFCDSSDDATGAVLVQKRADGTFDVLGYHSHKFTAAERAFSVREREFLAALSCAKRYRAWFTLARAVTVYTDHQSLATLLSTNKQQSDRLTRWCATLSEFNLTFSWLRGAENTFADAVSRRFLNVSKLARRSEKLPVGAVWISYTNGVHALVEDAELRAEEVDATATAESLGNLGLPAPFIPQEWTGQLINDLRADEYFAAIHEYLSNPDAGERTTSQTRARARFMVLADNGLLWNISDPKGPRLALPAGMVREQVIAGAHASAGHPNHVALSAMLTKAYFAPGFGEIIAQATAGCEVCAKHKHKTLATGFAANHSAPTRRLGSLVTDIFSGLPESGGYTQVLLIRDQLTKTTVLAPLTANADTTEVLAAIESNWIAVYGFPDSIWCDKGPQYASRQFQKYFSDNHVALEYATSQHHVPEAERAIRTARACIRTMSDRPGEWLRVLHLCQLAMNRQVSKSDGMSANERLFGFNVALPLLPSSDEARVSPRVGCEASAEKLVQLIDAFYATKERLACGFDHGRVLSGIEVGSQVLVKRELVKAFDGPVTDAKAIKSRSPFVGPFPVVEDKGHGNWRLVGLERLNKVQPVFHESALKLLGRRKVSAPTQPGLRHGDLFWPDGSRRVLEVVEVRSLHGFTHHRVKFVGGAADDPGTWLALNQLHLFDQQKILDFIAKAGPYQPPAGVDLDRPAFNAVSLRA
jgi:hypothetical protein